MVRPADPAVCRRSWQYGRTRHGRLPGRVQSPGRGPPGFGSPPRSRRGQRLEHPSRHREAVPRCRRGRPAEGVAPPQLRQGAVPRPLPAGPGPSPSPPDRRGPSQGRRLPRPARSLPARRGRPGGDRARRQDPRQRGEGPLRPWCPRHEDRRGVRGARPLQRLLQPGPGHGRHVPLRPQHPPQRPPVDRCPAAPQAVRHARAEAQVPTGRGPGPDQRLPAHRA